MSYWEAVDYWKVKGIQNELAGMVEMKILNTSNMSFDLDTFDCYNQ